MSDPERDFWTDWPSASPARGLFWAAVLILSLLPVCRACAQEQARADLARHAVVQVPSHGGSATVIESGPGRSLLLSCSHMFEGAALRQPIRVDVPSPAPGPERRAGVRLLALDRQADLSLIEVGAELPYCAPVAPATHRIDPACLSIGFDEMRRPPQVRAATVVSGDALRLYTRERPWHGRSGGALLDARTGRLVGVVQGYEAIPGGRGIYASHRAVLAFLARQRVGPDVQTPAPRPDPPDLFWPQPLPRGQQQCPS